MGTGSPDSSRIDQRLDLDRRREDFARQRSRWRARPQVREFGATSRCNLKCPMCGHSNASRPVVTAAREDRLALDEEVPPSVSPPRPFTVRAPFLSPLDEIVPTCGIRAPSSTS